MSFGTNAPLLSNISAGTLALGTLNGVASQAIRNTAIGSGSLASLQDLTTNVDYTAIGYNSLNKANFSGSLVFTVGSTAIGSNCLANLTNGTSNVAIGDYAGQNLTTGNGNILIGSSVARTTIVSASNNIYIGVVIPSSNSASYETIISNSSTGAIGYGSFTALINAPQGLYFTNPAIASFDFRIYDVVVNSSGNYKPYYSYNSYTDSLRGITFVNNSSGIGGYWKFNVPGTYEIIINWSGLHATTAQQQTILCSVTSPGGSSTTVIKGSYWGTPTSTSMTINTTLVTQIVADTSLYYFVSELASSVSVSSPFGGGVNIKWISL